MYGARLRENLPAVKERIVRALERGGRGGAVGIVAVTKGHPVEAVRAAVAAGLADCGENRVSELARKRAELGDLARWHLIGHLQRNKVRQALPLFELLHSLDSLRLAREVSGEAARAAAEVRALVQVNASGEAAKGGFDVAAGPEAIAEVVAVPKLRIEGLMTMAPLTDDEGVLRATFRRTRALFDECARSIPGFEPRFLSMGMSNDFEIAVEEGSNLVRLGTILFGERSQ
jgi:hypothetical protein